MDIIAVITLLGIVQGFFLGSLLLLSRGQNSRANRFLGVLFICYSLSILHFFMDRTGLYQQFPHLLRVGLPVLFLFGPLFYFYVRTLTDRTVQLSWRDLLHGVPFLVVVLLLLPSYLESTEGKLEAVRTIQTYAAQPVWLLISTLQVLHLFAYMIAVRRILHRYDKRIHDTRSSIERINLRWLRIGNNLFFLVFGFIQILIILQALGVPTVSLYHISIPLIVTAIIYGLGYLGLRQPELFMPGEEATPGRKYERSAITPDLARNYALRLQKHMADSRPYLDSGLTLAGLAAQLDIPPHQLSQVINESLGTSFFDYVNKLRVEEAKRLLQDSAKSAYTILAVAEEAGFNSKSAFNAGFKKYAGMTPSEFRQRNPSSN